MTPHTTQNHLISTKQSGFTLVELLVVIAIIGVLAAVGTQAYTGYTATAKIKASESNFANVRNFIGAELVKCSTGGQLASVDGIPAPPNCAAGKPTIAQLGTHFNNYFRARNAGVMNPHQTNIAAASSASGAPGAIIIAPQTGPDRISVRGWTTPGVPEPLSASLVFE